MQRSILMLAMSVTATVALGALAGCMVLTPGTAASGPEETSREDHTGIVALPEAIQERGVLRMGSQLASPPLIFQTEGTTEVGGINKDIADEIGTRLGVSITWSQFPFAGLIPAVQSGKIDAAMDVIGDTDERREAVDFANYMNQATSPLVQRGNPHDVQSVDDLCGLSVAIVRGGYQIDLAEEASARCVSAGKNEIQINQYNNPGDARLSVQSGRDAAFLGNTPVMRYISEQEATKAFFEVGGNDVYQMQPIGVITAKADRDLRESIQSALDQMAADGTTAKLLAKWDVEDLALDEEDTE